MQFSRCVLGCPGSFKPSQLRGSVSFGTDNRQSRFQRSLACRAHPSVEVSTYRRSFKTIQKSIILLVRFDASFSLTIFSTPCVVLADVLHRLAGLSGFLQQMLLCCRPRIWLVLHSPFLPRKEVIQPHLPIRLPCYDFTPVIWLTFGSWLLAVTSLTSGALNSHGVTGGVYKARERIHRDMLIRDY